jgi:hypothetical protein
VRGVGGAAPSTQSPTISTPMRVARTRARTRTHNRNCGGTGTRTCDPQPRHAKCTAARGATPRAANRRCCNRRGGEVGRLCMRVARTYTHARTHARTHKACALPPCPSRTEGLRSPRPLHKHTLYQLTALPSQPPPIPSRGRTCPPARSSPTRRLLLHNPHPRPARSSTRSAPRHRQPRGDPGRRETPTWGRGGRRKAA